MKVLGATFAESWLGRFITRVVGRQGGFRFRLARDTIGVMIIRVFSMGLGFAVSVVLARLLGVREFGLYSLAMSVLGLLVVPATFGFPQLLVREIAAYRVKGKWGLIRGLLRFAQRTSLLVSLSIALLGWLTLWLLSDRFSGETLQVLALAFLALPFWALLQLHGEALRGFERILASQWVSTVTRPLSFLILIGVTWFFFRKLENASFALGLHILATGIALAFAFYLLRSQVRCSVPTNALSQNTAVWTRSALFLALLGILYIVPQHIGILFISFFRNIEEVGLYKVAYQVSSFIVIGFSAINIALGPTVSEVYAQRNLQLLRRLLFMAGVAAFTFSLPLSLLFFLKGSWFLSAVFGEEFHQSSMSLIILTLGQVIFATFGGPIGLMLVMTGSESKATLSFGIAVAIDVLLNIVLIPYWGIVGAAWAFTIAFAVLSILRLYFAIKFFRSTAP